MALWAISCSAMSDYYYLENKGRFHQRVNVFFFLYVLIVLTSARLIFILLSRVEMQSKRRCHTIKINAKLSIEHVLLKSHSIQT